MPCLLFPNNHVYRLVYGSLDKFSQGFVIFTFFFLPNFHDRDLKMILKICGVCRTVLDFSFNRTIT